jgi:GLPGLI family protein
MKKIVLLAVAAMASLSIAAQGLTEGRVVTGISYPDMEDNTGILAMLPKETTAWYKGDKVRIEQPGAMGSKTIILVDNKKKETHTYFDMMGTKYEIVSNEKDVLEQNAKAGDYAITPTTETKSIAGYNCKKSIAKGKDGEEIELWFAPDLARPNSNWTSPYKGIDGMMMEFSTSKQTSMGPMTMKMTVKEVAKEPVDDAKFKAPDGTWKKVTMAEFMKSMGGGK